MSNKTQCPVCEDEFVDIEKHVRGQHPEEADEALADLVPEEVAEVVVNGRVVRTYTQKQGDDPHALAESFAEKVGGTVR